jgi:hypothetical protein
MAGDGTSASEAQTFFARQGNAVHGANANGLANERNTARTTQRMRISEMRKSNGI